MSFTENSYLGKQIEVIRNDFITKNTKSVEVLNNLNKDLNIILSNLKYTDEYEKDNILIGLFCNIIETFNSIIILNNYGLASNTQTLLRSLIEYIFNYCAIVRDEDHYSDFLDRGNAETKRLADLIEKNSTTFNNNDLNEKVEKLKAESELYNKKYTHLSVESLSKRAKMHEVFLYTYNILCLETHGNVKSIIKNHIEYTDNEIVLSFQPNYDYFEYIFITTVQVLIHFMSATQEYFGDDYTAITNRYQEAVKDMDSKS